MSFSQTLAGCAIMTSLCTLAIQTIAPAPHPLDVHALRYVHQDGQHYVEQDRTVRTDGPAFFAEWRAEVVSADSGKQVCGGRGAWNYEPGRGAFRMTLAKWTGDVGCTALAPGDYFLRATWTWGADQTSARSEPFTVE